MKPLLCFLILLSVGNIHATDKIEGAFGLKLGDAIEPIGPVVSQKGFGQGYEFTPKAPNSAFTKYLVFVTPRSHLIYQIVAVHREGPQASVAPNDHDLQARKCNEIVAKVQAILRQKYRNGGDPHMRILQGDREVSFTSITCEPGYCEVAVAYVDETLARKAGQERFDDEQKTILKDADPTGL